MVRLKVLQWLLVVLPLLPLLLSLRLPTLWLSMVVVVVVVVVGHRGGHPIVAMVWVRGTVGGLGLFVLLKLKTLLRRQCLLKHGMIFGVQVNHFVLRNNAKKMAEGTVL
jgi:hypothetical protein